MAYKYPGVDNHFIMCDICGFKFRVKDTVQVTDKFSPHYKMIVCKKDLDTTNPVLYPHTLPKENFLTNPTFVRPESNNLIYAPNPNSDRLPSAPRNLTATMDSLQNYIALNWEGPLDLGSSPILGYRVTRATPQLSYQDILISNTQSQAPYYLDISGDINAEYTYQVAAISDLGVGPYSNFAFWPRINVSLETNDLTTDTHITLSTDSGVYITI